MTGDAPRPLLDCVREALALVYGEGASASVGPDGATVEVTVPARVSVDEARALERELAGAGAVVRVLR